MTRVCLLVVPFLATVFIAACGSNLAGAPDSPTSDDSGAVKGSGSSSGAHHSSSSSGGGSSSGSTVGSGGDDASAGEDAGVGEDAPSGEDASSGDDASEADDGGILVRVTNNCPIDLWIHSENNPAPPATPVILTPDNLHLAPGASQDYQAPFNWASARVNAFLQAPDGNGNPQGQSDKIEASFYVQNGSEYVNSDITYVDWVALPSQIQVIGTGSDCTTASCSVPYAQILNGCPSSLVSGQECLSAGSYCLDPNNQGDPYCSALDGQISQCASNYSDCAGAAGSSTAEVYSCSGGFFGGSPQYCAALNRGILSAPTAATPASSFYQNPPFNTYAQWVHQQCPGIYAFPYDDFGPSNESSDHTCTGATQMNVTFCPGG